MSSLTRRLRSTLRKAARPVARLAPSRGPFGRRPFVVQAKAQQAIDRGKDHPDSALALADQLIAQRPDLTYGWKAAISISKAAKDDEQALDYARRCVEAGSASTDILLQYRKLAVKLRDDVAARHADAELVRLTPTSPKQIQQVARALRFSSLQVAREFRDRLAGSSLDPMPVDDVIAELDILESARAGDGAGPSGSGSRTDSPALAAARRVATERPGGLAIAVTGLQRGRAWHDLVALLEDRAGPDGGPLADAGLPANQLDQAASRAFADGWTGEAVTLARWALAQDPSKDQMKGIVAEGAEQDRLMRDGWPVPRHAPPAYDAAPRSVLSLLGQSLPIRSGGYATRSHGILTGVADRGWSVRAATRLGFPYDLWWSADDERTVAPVDVVDGVPYHRLLHDGVRDYPRFPLPDYVADGAKAVEELARIHRPALLHASSLYDVGLTGLTAARHLGIPFIYEMRGLKQLLEEARLPHFRQTQRSQYLDLLEATVAKEADAVFVITEALGHAMVRLGVPEERIVVVPNGVHADRFAPRAKDAELERALGLSGKIVIGYAGGFVGYEGLELLLTAVAGLKAERDDFHVVLVGDGARDRALRALARNLRIEDVVTFTGRVGHDVVERYISLFDITPFPRLPVPVCELISPIKPFEAMAMAKAVVVSDVEALTEIVTDGRTGRSFAKGDPDDLRRVLGELISDPAQRARLGEQARAWVVAERDWAAITATVAEAYDRVVPRAARTAS
ncbi:glycosyltransferase family 4 protein [Intrasporangium sp.]|uniref:glycosyltransferase family 4 protein n=1 Tax=Intrasporangium sp. TaxID=1925024 RepID=UPI00293A62CB|nr:glycosyltransferase family 4 protein [Intrasporangium sp.]MDV3219803.1 glycosyltransferase family 4 protein [Intrasporangium sp.]